MKSNIHILCSLVALWLHLAVVMFTLVFWDLQRPGMQGFLFCLLKLLSKEGKNYGSKENRKIVSCRRIGAFFTKLPFI